MDALVPVAREALLLALVVSLPVVLAAAAAGLLAGVFQTVTQIQDPTVAHAPRLVAVLVALAIASPWIGAHLVRFTTAVLEAIPRVT